MHRNLVYLVIVMTLNLLLVYTYKQKTKPVVHVNNPVVVPIQEPVAPPILPKPVRVEPTWIVLKPLRSVTNLGTVLNDIDSHLQAGHIYRDSDKITWGHETTHGINSRLRQLYQGQGRINGFYVLQDRGVIIQEPKTTIQAVARAIPPSLRGGVYSLYLIQQAPSWGDTPLYIFDEWTAYTNGSAVRKDLNITERAETVQYMMEFDVYAMTLAMVMKQQDPNYDDKQFKAYLMWNIERSMSLYANESGATNVLNGLRNNPDAAALRKFSKEYFGEMWCKEVLGI